MNTKDFDNENFSLFSNYNAFLKHPALINISGIRMYAISELYKTIEFWDKTKLDKIPYSIVYLRIGSKKGYKDEVLLKACMIEEQIHKLAIFENRDLYNQTRLNYYYYKSLYMYLTKLRYNQVFNTKPPKLNFEKSNIYNEFIKPLINTIPEDSPSKTHLEILYTKLSVYDEYMKWQMYPQYFENTRTNQQLFNMQNIHENLSLYNYGNIMVHNGVKLTEPYTCLICADGCTEYADCMYSNCRHLCMCYNCSSKLSGKDKTKCIICRQHNDCLLQILKP
jgi:hypothetical protein